MTHGICPDCSRAISDQIGRGLPEFLDTLITAVVATDANGVVGAVNAAARHVLDGETGPGPQLMIGDVTECEYARLPGGCGGTRHCTACDLRNAITETYRTGTGREDLTITQRAVTKTGLVTRRYRAATKKSGEVVLLRIDQIDDTPPTDEA